MKLYTKILLGLLGVFIIIQFIQPAHNKTEMTSATGMMKKYTVPDNVQALLKNSCYDCHSNNTRYPWYFNIQPMGWILASHIKEGKDDLNFDEFETYSLRKQMNKFRAMETSISDGSMPISSYTFMHKDARLTPVDTAILKSWIRRTKDSLSTKN